LLAITTFRQLSLQAFLPKANKYQTKSIHSGQKSETKQINPMSQDEDDPNMPECPYCGETPCFLEQPFDDTNGSSEYTLYSCLMEQGEMMMESGMSNKEVRFALYRTAAIFCFGNLGHGNRKEIPQCIMTEIKDAFPAATGEPYTGFKSTK
jgi:hypothetical protein